MANKKQMRSEEMKRNIIAAASQLFAENGFDAVTMREIAAKAKCSHTTIYLYFKDKEDLLHQLASEPLQLLHQQFAKVLVSSDSPRLKLLELSRLFIRFCLHNRNMYTIFFAVKASRVDEEPELPINRQRLVLFGQLQAALREFLPQRTNHDEVLSASRIFFYMLHGIVGTYALSMESAEQLIDRLGGTFDEAIDMLISGMKDRFDRRG